MTVHERIRRRLLRDVHDRLPSPRSLTRTERCMEFDQLRINRKIIGAFRYGMIGAHGKPRYDRVSDCIERLRLYQQDHNAEHLVDVANLMELEFVEGDAVVTPTDDGTHTREKT
jgi:hypothetical protein